MVCSMIGSAVVSRELWRVHFLDPLPAIHKQTPPPPITRCHARNLVNSRRESCCYHGNASIPFRMVVGVVEQFEELNIEHDDRQPSFCRCKASDFRRKYDFQLTTITETCQSIRNSHLCQLVTQALKLNMIGDTGTQNYRVDRLCDVIDRT